MNATAIVPVKRFGAAKQRLSDALSAEARATLAAAMAADVLEAVAAAETIERTIVVSGELRIQPIARAAGAELIDDPHDRGHSEAALVGVAEAIAAGARAVALLPGDCPLLDPGELDRAVGRMRARYVGIIPDRHGSGTNGLLLCPPDAIAAAFGPGSRERHARLAARRELATEVVEVPSLALDLDERADLELLRARVPAGAAGGRLGVALERISAEAAKSGADRAPD